MPLTTLLPGIRFSREEGGGVGLGSRSAAEARRQIDLFFPTHPNSNSFLR